MNPIVIEHGSYKCRAGFAGEDIPRTQFFSLTGRPTTADSGIVTDRELSGTYVGDRLIPLVDRLKLRYPIEFGYITSLDDVEQIWRHVFCEQLCVDPSEHPVLLSEPPRNPKINREKVTTLMFESFDVPAFHLAQQCVLSLFSTGRTDGIVLDSGHRVTHIVPVHEGRDIKMGSLKLDLGGSYVTDQLRKRLKERNIFFKSPSESMNLHDFAQKHCYTAVNFESELQDYDRVKNNDQFQLPDGKIITLGAERFQSVELLFQPIKFGFEFPGVHDLLNNSISRLDDSIREDLFANIVIAGGATMYPKFEERLQKEMSVYNRDARVIAPVDRHLSAWRGGAMVASLPAFLETCITKDDYDEYGPELVHRKCL